MRMQGMNNEDAFLCPVFKQKVLDVAEYPAPHELSWDLCSNGGISIVFSVAIFWALLVAIRLLNGESFGKILRRPIGTFTPPSLRVFSAVLGTLSILVTVPMVFTRYTTGRWTATFALQQFLPNLFVNLVGCEPLNGGDNRFIEYALDGVAETDDRLDIIDHNIWTDAAILPHFSFGVLWDLVATIQIMAATYAFSHKQEKKGGWTFHKSFGYFSILVFLGHMAFALHILFRDIVHHNAFTKFCLYSDVVQSSVFIWRGVQSVTKTKDSSANARAPPDDTQLTTHKVLMFFGYVHAMEGSGQIRFSTWWIWMVSRFVPMRYAVYFDTTVCQTSNFGVCPTASVGNCILPYIIRMNMVRFLTIVFKYIFFHISEHTRLKHTRSFVRAELLCQAGAWMMSLFGILWIEFRVDDQVPWLGSYFGKDLYSVLFFGVPLILHLTTKKQFVVILLVLGLIFGSASQSLVAMTSDATWLVLSTLLFVGVTNDYVDAVVGLIESDEAPKKVETSE